MRFIARLDCGDTCSATRFFAQVAFFEGHPAIDLLGSWCCFRKKETNAAYRYTTPTQHKFIKRSMYFRNVFIHPTAMWRVARLNLIHYPENYPHAEDYGLFYDIVSKRKTAILGEFLVTCEINEQGISFINRSAQLRSRLRVIWDYGENKLLTISGIFKLVLLMAVPYGIVYRIKQQLFKHKPSRPGKIGIL